MPVSTQMHHWRDVVEILARHGSNSNDLPAEKPNTPRPYSEANSSAKIEGDVLQRTF